MSSRKRRIEVPYAGVTLVYGIPIDAGLYQQLCHYSPIQFEPKTQKIEKLDNVDKVNHGNNNLVARTDELNQVSQINRMEAIEQLLPLAPIKRVKLDDSNTVDKTSVAASSNPVGTLQTSKSLLPLSSLDAEEQLYISIPQTAYSIQCYQDGATTNNLYFLQIQPSQLIYDDSQTKSVLRINEAPNALKITEFLQWVKKHCPTLSPDYGLYSICEIVIEKYIVYG